MNRAVEY